MLQPKYAFSPAFHFTGRSANEQLDNPFIGVSFANCRRGGVPLEFVRSRSRGLMESMELISAEQTAFLQCKANAETQLHR
jgi:hypothetical protein